MRAFDELLETMRRLRGPDGCPWDREQDLDSLKGYVLEEAHELVEAMDSADADALREELGDLLLEVVFVTQVATESDLLTMEQVVCGIRDKMVRRHPHVFADADARDADEALAQWEAAKRAEKKAAGRGALDGVPRTLPALLRGQRLSEKAAAVGFEWSHRDDLVAKLDEELGELGRAFAADDGAAVREELGDVLFTLVNVARRSGLDAEDCLQAANRKFAARFAHTERQAEAEGRELSELDADALDVLWERAKAATSPTD